VTCAKLGRLARSDSEILLVGETGVGKDVFANAIHAHSGRGGRFVAINCAAIPRELAESELFGYEKGAHSTAQGRKVGLVELANGGTLFLDEIGDMPPELQSKLLRFLQDRRFTPWDPRASSRRTCASSPPPAASTCRRARTCRRPCWAAWARSRSCCRRCAIASRTSAAWSRIFWATCATAARSSPKRSTRCACTRGR
jgi:transcriptional regulator with AAA-type ATPase domain